VDALHAAVNPHAGKQMLGPVAIAAVELNTFINDSALRSLLQETEKISR
jgi:hypothetical protein